MRKPMTAKEPYIAVQIVKIINSALGNFVRSDIDW
uniref:Uncharacterized protein n=1 Tax=Arundo donax TaxID=35708 RepID=A0A0A9H1Q8_ARUDO